MRIEEEKNNHTQCGVYFDCCQMKSNFSSEKFYNAKLLWNERILRLSCMLEKKKILPWSNLYVYCVCIFKRCVVLFFSFSSLLFNCTEQHIYKKVPHCGKTEVASNEDGDRWRRQPRMLVSYSLILSIARNNAWAILTHVFLSFCLDRSWYCSVKEKCLWCAHERRTNTQTHIYTCTELTHTHTYSRARIHIFTYTQADSLSVHMAIRHEVVFRRKMTNRKWKKKKLIRASH